jgi:hypothetical protein
MTHGALSTELERVGRTVREVLVTRDPSKHARLYAWLLDWNLQDRLLGLGAYALAEVTM